jgi:hypothetical protein
MSLKLRPNSSRKANLLVAVVWKSLIGCSNLVVGEARKDKTIKNFKAAEAEALIGKT